MVNIFRTSGQYESGRLLYSTVLSILQRGGRNRLATRGGHRHLQIDQTLDIDLISEPPQMYPKWESVWPEGAGSDS